MKIFFTGSLLFLLCTTISPKPAQALTFADTVLFSSGSDPFVNVAYTTSQSSGFSWTHQIGDNLAGQDLTGVSFLDAVLTVVYSRTNLDELWQVENLGNLASNFNELTSVFALPPNQVQDLKQGFLTFKLKELTSGADSMRMHSALLKGNYEVNKRAAAPSIPEPETFFLMMLSAFSFCLCRTHQMTDRGHLI
jgi:hypothetical protein